jgi:hypothetical protein
MSAHSIVPLRIVVWLVLLLAAWGILQYVAHAWTVLQLMGRHGLAHGSLWPVLGWDVLYLLVAGLTVMAATGVLMWRVWARSLLRGLAFVLALYSLASAVMLFAHWQSFSHASADLIAQASDPQLAQRMFAQTRRVTLVGLALKVLAALLLGWLGWRLGNPALVQRFGQMPRKR